MTTSRRGAKTKGKREHVYCCQLSQSVLNVRGRFKEKKKKRLLVAATTCTVRCFGPIVHVPIEESFSRLFDISFFLIAVFRRVCLCVGVSWVLSPRVHPRP